MKNKLFGFLYAMNYMANAAWSFIFPAGLVIGLGWFLWNRQICGRWVMILSIVLGVLLGLYNMFYFLIRMADHSVGYEEKKHQNGKNR